MNAIRNTNIDKINYILDQMEKQQNQDLDENDDTLYIKEDTYALNAEEIIKDCDHSKDASAKVEMKVILEETDERYKDILAEVKHD